MISTRCHVPFGITRPSPGSTSILASVSTVREVNKAEFRISALANSTSQQFVEKNIGKATLLTTRDYDEAVRMVLEDEVDLMVADMTICILSAMPHQESGLINRYSCQTILPSLHVDALCGTAGPDQVPS